MASDAQRTNEQPKSILPRLTDRIVQTYQEVGINHLGHCPLPNYDEIISSLDALKEVIYPGYRRRENLHAGNIRYHVGGMIDGLQDTLSTQIARALRHDDRVGRGIRGCSDEEGDFEVQGQAMAAAFLDRLPELRQVLAWDVQAAYEGDPACKNYDEVIFCYPGLEAVTVYRLAHALLSLGVPLIPRMMTEWAHKQTGIDIHPGARIGTHFFIDHGTGVVIGETCVIGNWVKIYQGVTLGALSFPTDDQGNLVRDMKRHPTIEDRVVLYANATVLGGDTVVGRNSVVGSSVWLTHSVGPNSTVMIEKPKLRIRAENVVSGPFRAAPGA